MKLAKSKNIKIRFFKRAETLAWFIIFIALLSLALPRQAFALYEMSGTTHKVQRSVLHQGGGRSSSASNILGASAGEVLSGLAASTNYRLSKGFWSVSNYPGTITTLMAISSTTSSGVSLVWIAPGADGTVNLAKTYVVRYTTAGPIGNELGFSTATNFAQAWTPVSPLAIEGQYVNNLTLDATYYFSVKATTGVSNNVHGFISTGTVSAIAGTAPNPITDLSAVTGNLPGTLFLNWTSPGDDGTTGTAQAYIIKMATAANIAPALSESSFIVAQNLASTSPVPVPLAAGTSIQFVMITGLIENVTYYFSIKAYDDFGLRSILSAGATAVAQGTILSVSVDSDTYDFGTFLAAQSTITARPIVVTNTGNITQKYLLKAATGTVNSPWSLGDGRGNDVIVLNGLFNSGRPTDGNFEAVGSTIAVADAVAGTAGGNFAGDENGDSVPIGANRNVWFRLGMPLSTSTTDQQIVQFTITATP